MGDREPVDPEMFGREPLTLVAEEPVEYLGHVWSPRRQPGAAIWAVYRDDSTAPVGYLTAVFDTQEDVWAITVTDRNNRQIGEHGKRDNPAIPPAVLSLHDAMFWIDCRERGLA